MRHSFIAIAIAAIILAGCASPGETPAGLPASGTTTPDARPVERHARTFHTVVGNRELHTVLPPDVLAFNTTGNLTAIVLLLTWDDPGQVLQPFLQSSSVRCWDHGSGPLDEVGEQVQCQVETLGGAPRDGEFRGGEPFHEDAQTRLLVIQGDDLGPVVTRCGDGCRWSAWPESRMWGVPPTVNVNSALLALAVYDGLDPELALAGLAGQP